MAQIKNKKRKNKTKTKTKTKKPWSRTCKGTKYTMIGSSNIKKTWSYKDKIYN